MSKKILSVFISLILILSVCTTPAVFAEEKYVTVQIGTSTKNFEVEDGDISSALNDAMKYCSGLVDANNTAVIKTPAGEYNTKKVIRLSSYIELDLTGTTLVKGNDGDKNIFVSPSNEKGGYSSLSSFTLTGGVLKYSPDYNRGNCLVRIAHANHILIDGTSFLDSVNAHDVELAACKDFTVKDCTFSGQTVNSDKTSMEALQIDILEEQQHFVNMYPYDDTMNYGITVTGCVFKNLYRAVGTHSLFEGLYQSGININNNTFENITATAISCSNYINTKITNNTIKNCGEGIFFYMMKSDGYLSGVSKPCVKKPKINTDCKSVISGNTISVKSGPLVSAAPIYIFGNEVTSKKSKTVTKGNYYVGNITVSNNTITTDRYGIRAYDVRNSVFKGNKITYTGKKASIYSFLIGAKSKKNKILSNTINNFEGGVNLKEASTGNTISGNTIKNSKGNAIILQDTSTADKITSNSITTAKKVGILVKDKANVSELSSNTVSKCSSNAISIYSKVGKISKNTFKSNQGFGIYIANGASANVYNNTYSKNTKGNAYSKGKTSYKFSNISTPDFKPAKKSISKKKNSAKKVCITWKAPKVTSTYYIYRSTSKNGTYKKLAAVSSKKKAYTDKKVSKKKTYYYRIRAVKTMNSTKAYSSYKTKSIKI